MAAKHPFDYHCPSEAQVAQIATARASFKATHEVLMALPASRERSLAVTKLQEASMWANCGVVMQDERPVESSIPDHLDVPATSTRIS